jgi:hypothetical protein
LGNLHIAIPQHFINPPARRPISQWNQRIQPRIVAWHLSKTVATIPTLLNIVKTDVVALRTSHCVDGRAEYREELDMDLAVGTPIIREGIAIVNQL